MSNKTPNKKPDARITKSRKALIEAGMALLIQNPDASLSDIAQYAGVGRATLYRQFETRDELVACIIKSCLQKFGDVTQPIETEASSALDAIRLLFDLLLPLESEMSFLMKFEASISEKAGPENQEIHQIMQSQQQEIRDLFAACQQEKSIDPKLPLAWLESLLDGLFFAAWRCISESDTTCEKAAKLAFDSFCKGVVVQTSIKS